MIPEDLMRKYKYGYVHSCEMLNEPFVKDLLKENKILKDKVQDLQADYGTQAQIERDMLRKENQELKKQVDELELIVGIRQKRNLISKFDKEYDEEDKKKNPNRDYAGVSPDAEEVYKRYYELKAQQKEFIKYLEDYINSLKKEHGNYVNDDYSEEYGRYHTSKEILSKYKEIIGSDKE